MRQSEPRQHKFRRWPSTLLCVALVCACQLSSASAAAQAQRGVRRAAEVTGAERRESEAARRQLDEFARRAMNAACAEREQDPQGSAPIDEMQARPSLPLRHAEVLAGAERAERLLPVAKNLAAESLRVLLREYGIRESAAVRAAFARLARVRAVEPDIELRDNASVIYKEPRTIRFGTIFLAGLRSDEGMLSVLAHELTHVADGAQGSLVALFQGVARRARGRGQLQRINLRRGEELTCDLVGAHAVRAYIARTPSVETLARRTSRALAHNCVERDHTDRSHLSPRTTMRALLILDPALAQAITGEALEASAPPVAPQRRTPRRAAHPFPPQPKPRP
ncbi:MAG TPA: hypothetical protein VER76_09580 [Pyrinomonadaceae bacterium]|nr:hypothetical protein [Pyrinomonadaceae bacterium]